MGQAFMYDYIEDREILRGKGGGAVGNTGDRAHLPALRKARETTDNPHVHKAIVWAIDRLASERV